MQQWNLSGCRCTWDNASAALPQDCPSGAGHWHGVWRRGEQSCAQKHAVGSPCNRQHRVQAHFRQISARCMEVDRQLSILPFRWLVNCLLVNGNKWIKWIKSWLSLVKLLYFVINGNFATHLLLIYYQEKWCTSPPVHSFFVINEGTTSG